MTNEEQQQTPDTATEQGSPSDPPADPKRHPAPPSNPDVDEQDVERGREKIERIVGN